MPRTERQGQQDAMTLVSQAIDLISFGYEVVAHEDLTGEVAGTRTRMVKRSPMPGRFVARPIGRWGINVRFILLTNHRDPPHQPIEVQLSRDFDVRELEDRSRLLEALRSLAKEAWLHEFDEWWVVAGQRRDPHDDAREPPLQFPPELKF